MSKLYEKTAIKSMELANCHFSTAFPHLVFTTIPSGTVL